MKDRLAVVLIILIAQLIGLTFVLSSVFDGASSAGLVCYVAGGIYGLML